MMMMENSSQSIFNSAFSKGVDRETTVEKTYLSTRTFVPEHDHEYSQDFPKIRTMNMNPDLARTPSVVQLKKRKARSMSKQQRRKQRKGIEKAEISRAKLDKKKRDSCGKSRNMKNRKV